LSLGIYSYKIQRIANYRVEVWIDGSKIGEDYFTVTND